MVVDDGCVRCVGVWVCGGMNVKALGREIFFDHGCLCGCVGLE